MEAYPLKTDSSWAAELPMFLFSTSAVEVLASLSLFSLSTGFHSGYTSAYELPLAPTFSLLNLNFWSCLFYNWAISLWTSGPYDFRHLIIMAPTCVSGTTNKVSFREEALKWVNLWSFFLKVTLSVSVMSGSGAAGENRLFSCTMWVLGGRVRLSGPKSSCRALLWIWESEELHCPCGIIVDLE